MSDRAAVRLAWLLGLLSVALISSAVVLFFLNRPTRLAEDASTWGTANVSFILAAPALAFGLVGALVASRRPGNPIGWISLAVGLCLALSGVASEYAIYALLSQPGSLPGAKLAAWLGEWIWVPSVGLMGTFLVLLFPNGRLPSLRWRVVAWLAVAAMAFSGLSWLSSRVRSGRPLALRSRTRSVSRPLGASWSGSEPSAYSSCHSASSLRQFR